MYLECTMYVCVCIYLYHVCLCYISGNLVILCPYEQQTAYVIVVIRIIPSKASSISLSRVYHVCCMY